MADSKKEGAESDTRPHARGNQPNSDHSQTYTNDPDRLRETEEPNDQHQPYMCSLRFVSRLPF